MAGSATLKKFGRMTGGELMRIPGSLCITTTCSPQSIGIEGAQKPLSRPSGGVLYTILDINFREFTFRNCLENSRRCLESTTSAAEVGRSGLLRPILAAFGAPVLDPFRISKQFRKGNSANFAPTEFCELCP